VKRIAAALALVAASLAVHWPPAGAGFAQDDVDFVTANASLRSAGAAARALVAPFPPGQPERALYRPLTHLSFAADRALFGDHARGYHATNAVLYLANALLVQRLARAYALPPAAAFAAALLFAAHPVHCEAVDAIAGRSEILALLFAQLSLLLFTRALRLPEPGLALAPRSRSGSGLRSPTARCALRLPEPGLARGARRALWAAAALQGLACLAKESSAVLPGVLAVHVAAFSAPARAAGARAWLRGYLALAPSLALLAAYLALRTAVLGGFSPQAAPLAGADLATRLLTQGAVLFVYLRLLVFPDLLQVDFYYQVLIGIVHRPTLGSLLGWTLFLALLSVATRLLLAHLRADPSDEGSARRARRAAALCAFAIFFGFLLPVSHLVDIGVLAAERLLFAPSLGFVLLAVLAGERALARLAAPDLRRALATSLVLLLAASGMARSALRAAEWRDPARLWLSAERLLPGDARIPSNLATVYLERGDFAAAEAALARALALDPTARFARGNLGFLRLAEGRLDEAEAIFGELASSQPDDALAWTSLGRIEALRGRPDAARLHLERALALAPHLAPARVALEELSPPPGAPADAPP
jgi:tetratricopeptide (TPR) repeat protein